MRRSFAAATVGTAAAVFSLAGCGGSTAPKQTAFKSLNSEQQAAVENEAVIEVEANVSSFASFDPYQGLGFARVVPRRAAGLAGVVAGKIAQRPRFQSGGGCNPTVTGDATDADADGIPANATATFACDLSSNGDSASETGNLSFADPTPSAADLEYNASVNLTLAQITSSSGDLNLSLTGSSALTQAPGTLTDAGNTNLNFAITNAPSNGNGTLKLKTNSNATYTYTGADLTSFGSLPDGSFDLTGNWSYDVNSAQLTANLTFAVTTPGGLSIKSACANNEGHIDSGEIDIKFGDGTLVKAQYTGCPSEPTITVT